MSIKLLLSVLGSMGLLYAMDVPNLITTSTCPTPLTETTLNAQDTFGDTQLMWAVRSGSYELVQQLLDAGADTHIQERMGWTALIIAVHWNNDTLLRMLIKAGAPLDMQAHDGTTALLWAVQKNYKEMVRALLIAGARVDIKDADGCTPLMWATYRNYTDIAHILIAAGGQLEPKMRAYYYYAHLSSRLFKAAKVPFPADIQDDQAYQALIEALVVVKDFARQYMFVDLIDANGNTPIHYAVLSGNRVMVTVLLYLMAQAQRATSLLQTNKEGYTPIELAVIKSPYWVLPILRKALLSQT